MAFEAPLTAQDVVELLVSAARGAVRSVVSAHHALSFAFDDSGAESGQISLLQVALADDSVKAVPFRLGAAVDGEMLHRGNNFQVARVVALQAFDISDADARSEIWIFAECLHPPPPARIA